MRAMPRTAIKAGAKFWGVADEWARKLTVKEVRVSGSGSLYVFADHNGKEWIFNELEMFRSEADALKELKHRADLVIRAADRRLAEITGGATA